MLRSVSAEASGAIMLINAMLMSNVPSKFLFLIELFLFFIIGFINVCIKNCESRIQTFLPTDTAE